MSKASAAGESGSDSPSPITVATEASIALMQAVAEDNADRLEAFMQVIPDHLLDQAIAAKKEAG